MKNKNRKKFLKFYRMITINNLTKLKVRKMLNFIMNVFFKIYMQQIIKIHARI